MMSHPSHQLATFALATKLEKVGYRVKYCGPKYGIEKEDLSKNVLNQNFEYDLLDPYLSLEEEKNSDPLSTAEVTIRFLENLYSGHPYREFCKLHEPDIFILDIFYSSLVIVLTGMNVKVFMASTIILSDRDENIPPLNRYMFPASNEDEKESIDQIWELQIRDKKRKFLHS